LSRIALILVALLSACQGRLATAEEPPRILFDTDFRADCDDVGALAVLHALADDGECEILGVVASTTGPHIVAAIDAVNTYCGRPDLPIGLSAIEHVEHFDPYAPTLADTATYPSDQTNETAPDAVALYRRLLYEAPDQGVTVLVVGYATCAAELLKSGPDHQGDDIPLSGRELVEAKVAQMVQMAGVRAGGSSDTFNLGHDAQAAVSVQEHWPTPIVYTNPGKQIRAGSALSNPDQNPIAKAFELYPGAGPRGTIGDRQCWDQVATLYAVRGGSWNGETIWQQSPPCRMVFTIRHIPKPQNPEKDTAVDVRIEPDPDGNRSYITQVWDNDRTAELIEELMTRPRGNPNSID